MIDDRDEVRLSQSFLAQIRNASYRVLNRIASQILGMEDTELRVGPVAGILSSGLPTIGAHLSLEGDLVRWVLKGGSSGEVDARAVSSTCDSGFLVFTFDGDEAVRFSFLETDTHALHLAATIESRKREIRAIELAEIERQRADELEAKYRARTEALRAEFEALARQLALYKDEFDRIFEPSGYLRRAPFDAFLSRHSTDISNALDRLEAVQRERPHLGTVTGVNELRSVIAKQRKYPLDYNDQWAEQEIQRHRTTLLERLQLSSEQAHAAVRAERYGLVSAPAGSGKTRMLEGKGFHILEAHGAGASEILFLTFTSKTRKDLKRRIHRHSELKESRVATFHALGRWILLKTGHLRDISPLAKDRERFKGWVDAMLRDILADDRLDNPLRRFIEQGLIAAPSPQDATLESYFEQTSFRQMRTIDNISVRSAEEVIIANWFFTHGISYDYERPYRPCYLTDTFMKRRYCPDFYIPNAKTDDGDASGIYHEHLALNEHEQTPSWIDNDKYLRGVAWKKEQHRTFNTTLFTTRSSDFRDGAIFKMLDDYYRDRVAYQMRTNEEILNALGKRFSYISELFVTVFDNARSKALDIEDLRARVKRGDYRSTLFLDVYEELVQRYRAHLREEDTIDFDDMIQGAIKAVQTGEFKPPWRYLIVDEYQDVSENQIRLLEALNEHALQMLCVGDRRQAIYGFRGTESEAMLLFVDRFKYVDTRSLTFTYRSNERIAIPANEFIARGRPWYEPVQAVAGDGPHIFLLGDEYSDGKYDPIVLVRNTLERIERGDRNSDVLVLGRYRDHIPAHSELRNYALDIQCLTIHRAKGLEARYTILTDLTDGFFGFPATRSRDPLFQFLGSGDQAVEERSLMYVGLTRAKRYVFILTDWNAPSPFLDELLASGYVKVINAPKYIYQRAPCTKCGKGRIVRRFGRFVCSYHPVCDAYFDTCPSCQADFLRPRDDVVECSSCLHTITRCTRCDEGYVREVHGKRVGCSRYKSGKPVYSCGFMLTLQEVPSNWLYQALSADRASSNSVKNHSKSKKSPLRRSKRRS